MGLKGRRAMLAPHCCFTLSWAGLIARTQMSVSRDFGFGEFTRSKD